MSDIEWEVMVAWVDTHWEAVGIGPKGAQEYAIVLAEGATAQKAKDTLKAALYFTCQSPAGET